ncbi:MAG: UDP-2,3-diacylglucosamine diphosphatase LpxI [Synergistaceae bacterium]|jgi:DUF1009 family protein|nr:UDP-2,3-diacylglucosamine diphosphatase LpxI [Synergistaceae bacterium]
MSPANMLDTKSAIIAGEGLLPVEIAKRLASQGLTPLVLTLRDDGQVFKGISDPLVRLRYPSLSRVIKEIRRHGAQNVILAGQVPKKLIYVPALFDPLILKLLARTRRDDHSLLAAVVNVLEEEGITVSPYWHILPECLASEGALGHRRPTADEVRDFEYGMMVLKVTLPCSFGQALIVADGAVVAVEAMEGTDAVIRRAGELVPKGVLVKMMRADQDSRYDIPTVGPETIENMAQAGLTCLAVEANRTLIIDVEKTFALAKRYNIALWGLPCQSL